MQDEQGHRFYGDLAPWWHAISAPEDYEEEAAFAASLLRAGKGSVERVLELGSGGGNNASHLKHRFAMTLVDLSPSMLEMSRQLNPECEHIQGDMREVRLGRTFDAVFVHDAIDYMADQADLRAAIETAFAHCRPGGVAVLIPDHVLERFEPEASHGGHDRPDGSGVRYLEWTVHDGARAVTDYVFLLRDAGGEVQVVHDRHRTGLFSTATWLQLLAGAGFEVEAVDEITEEDRPPRLCFVAHRPE